MKPTPGYTQADLLREAIRTGKIRNCEGQYQKPRCGENCDCIARGGWEWAIEKIYKIERELGK